MSDRFYSPSPSRASRHARAFSAAAAADFSSAESSGGEEGFVPPPSLAGRRKERYAPARARASDEEYDLGAGVARHGHGEIEMAHHPLASRSGTTSAQAAARDKRFKWAWRGFIAFAIVGFAVIVALGVYFAYEK
ncbi:hypothetical protein JCM10207_007149 [Rhodosporidiobolus poonsookiae]